MIDYSPLVFAERDFASDLLNFDGQEEAARAALRFLSILFPESGAAVLSYLAPEPFGLDAGPKGPAAGACLRGIPTALASPAGQVFPLPDGNDLMAVVCLVASASFLPEPAVMVSLLRGLELYRMGLRRLKLSRRQVELLSDRDLLVREHRHRVRNSLQILQDTLSFLVETSVANASLDFFTVMNERLWALVSLHELLSWNASAASVAVDTYFADLVSSLSILARSAGGSLSAEVRGCRSASLAQDRALSVGLIVNELVTNSLKHTERSALRLRLLVDCSADALVLSYRDGGDSVASAPSAYGVPHPDGSAALPPAAFCRIGLGLVDAFLERAGGARLNAETSGFAFSARFPLS